MIARNSSPPSRPTVTPLRTTEAMRDPTSREHAVALFVAERVVHFLEAVEVDEQHRHVDALALAELLRSARRGSAGR